MASALPTGCGVFILAIDDNPAKASGMLRPGDEIVAVDGQTLLDHTHQECLGALRAVHGDSTLTIRCSGLDHLATNRHMLALPDHSPPVSTTV